MLWYILLRGPNGPLKDLSLPDTLSLMKAQIASDPAPAPPAAPLVGKFCNCSGVHGINQVVAY